MKKRFTKILALMLSVMLIMPLFSVEAKAGDDYDNAEAVDLGELVSNEYPGDHGYDQIKYYMFETEDAGIYTLNFLNITPESGKRAEITVEDKKHNEVCSYYTTYNFGSDSSTIGRRVELSCAKNEIIYVKIRLEVGTGLAFKITKGSRYYNSINLGNNGNGLAYAKTINVGDTVFTSDESFYDSHGSYNYCYKISTTKNPGSTYTFKCNNENILDKYYGMRIVIYDADYYPIYDKYFNYYEDFDIAEDFILEDSSTYYVYMLKTVGSEQYPEPDYGVRFSFTEKTNTTKPNKPIITALRAGKGTFTVKYGAVKNGASFYQIAYKKSNSKKWSYVTVSSRMLSKQVTGLSRNTKYNVMVRAIKNVEGNKYVGAWSTAKTVKTK